MMLVPVGVTVIKEGLGTILSCLVIAAFVLLYPCVPQLTLSRAYLTNNSTSSDTEALPEAGVRQNVSAQKGEAGKKPQANVTFEKARVKGAFW